MRRNIDLRKLDDERNDVTVVRTHRRKLPQKIINIVAHPRAVRGRKMVDVTGRRFGKLVALNFERRRSEGSGRPRTFWKCVCDCGGVKYVDATALRTLHTISCGCVRRETARAQMTTHGHAGTRIHKIWKGMWERCTNPNNRRWADYGGRGITVCEEWRDFESFLRDMGLSYRRHRTIDRIDNDGDYCKENCRWATWDQQANNKRTSRIIEFGGRVLTVAQWSRAIGVPRKTIENRLNRGWSPFAALYGGLRP